MLSVCFVPQNSDIRDEEQKEEVFWWHACWLSTTKQLNQWNSLNEFAKAIGPETSLALDCASKLQHWDLLDHLVDTFGIHSPYTKLCQASLPLGSGLVSFGFCSQHTSAGERRLVTVSEGGTCCVHTSSGASCENAYKVQTRSDRKLPHYHVFLPPRYAPSRQFYGNGGLLCSLLR